MADQTDDVRPEAEGGAGGAEAGTIPAPAALGPPPVAGPQRPPSFPTAALRVFDLSIGQMLWSRRTIFLALVVAAPVVLGVVIRVLMSTSLGRQVQVNGAPIASGGPVFGIFIWLLYLRFIVPVLGVFYGTSLIADEVEDRTITYLFTRPIARGSILVGKYLAYLAATTLVVLPSVMLLYFLVVPIGVGTLAGSFPALLMDLGLLGLGLAVYGALFAWVGARFKHPLVTGLVFAFGWEQGIMMVPGYLKRFTVAYYIQGLVPHTMPQDSTLSFLQAVMKGNLPAGWSLFWLVAIWAVFLYLAARTVERREYVLEQ
ncbi:MAG: ABC-type transport system involved in multi-copper enzyme maturation, permease component [Acidobacteria bacterium]|nr:ABC-type transport system involved in multi-copper enzyme maturation, permease component [Acidobacteriota bacterium]